MRVALSREMDRLESICPSSPPSAPPALTSACSAPCGASCTPSMPLGNVKQATLALVAPGISEALVATAIGLFAAIPAVIAYNRTRTRWSG